MDLRLDLKHRAMQVRLDSEMPGALIKVAGVQAMDETRDPIRERVEARDDRKP
jgi:hypothetical protein